MNVIVCYFISGSVNVPNTDKTPGDFRNWCARKKDFVAANIAAIILPRSVCPDTNSYISKRWSDDIVGACANFDGSPEESCV